MTHAHACQLNPTTTTIRSSHRTGMLTGTTTSDDGQGVAHCRTQTMDVNQPLPSHNGCSHGAEICPHHYATGIGIALLQCVRVYSACIAVPPTSRALHAAMVRVEIGRLECIHFYDDCPHHWGILLRRTRQKCFEPIGKTIHGCTTSPKTACPACRAMHSATHARLAVT